MSSQVDELTPRQAKVLEAIVQYQAKHGFPPNIRELGKAMDINSPNGVVTHLHALEAKRYIARSDGSPRAIRLLRKSDVEKVYEAQLRRSRE